MYFTNEKCGEERLSSNLNFDKKCSMNDNDSGYISQNIESNSSGEVSDFNNQILFSTSNMYVNEDTLMENPMENLYLTSATSNSIIPPSVSSHGDSFQALDSEDSEALDNTNISPEIPVVGPIIVSDNKFLSANNNEDVNITVSSTNNLSCVQTRMMDANNCNMSLFESFYSFVCDLYTNIDAPLEDMPTVSVTPVDLRTQAKEPSSSYIQLETRNSQDLHLANSSSNDCPVSIKKTCEQSESPTTKFVNAFLNPIHSTDSSTSAISISSCLPTSDSKNNQVETISEKVENDLISAAPSDSISYSDHNAVHSESATNFAGVFNSVSQCENELSKDIANSSKIESTESSENSSLNCNTKEASPVKSLKDLTDPSTNSERSDDLAPVNENITAVSITTMDSTPTVAEAVSLVTTTNNSSSKNDLTNIAENMTKEKTVTENKRETFIKSILKRPPRPVDSSPELFSDEEFIESCSMRIIPPPQKSGLYLTQTDKKLFKHAQESVTGVPPPPSVTILQITIDEMLEKIKENQHLFLTSDDIKSFKEGASTSKVSDSTFKRESLLVRCKREDFDPESWPDIMNYRYHGLYFNRNVLSEEFENLCNKYTERCIGAETQSSCTVFGINACQSPSKHKCRPKRQLKSPGKRLSHLARRRITFSKDSLNNSTYGSGSFIGARTRQIMVDVRKCQMLKHKSPKKKTPVKSPRKRITPSSSSKKRFARRLRMYSIDDNTNSVASTSTAKLSATKRALFQSPSRNDAKDSVQAPSQNASDVESSQTRRRTPRRALFPSPLKPSPSKMTISSLYPPKRKAALKKALFTSPEKLQKNNSNSILEKKRKRSEDDDCERPSKVPNNNLTDSATKCVSDVGNQNLSKVSGSTSQSATDNRKKKLMWAVAEALRSQNIDLKHPQFKVYASALARVIRNFLPNLFVNGFRPEGSTTESMMRIARKYVFSITRGKTVEQIIKEAEIEKQKISKLTKYVGIDKIESSSSSQTRHKEGVLQDRLNIISSQKTVSESNKNVRRGLGNVERIRKVINFGDDDVKNSSIR